MKKTTDYIDELIKKQKIKNDNQAAQLIGCTRQAISQYRTGKNVMNSVIATKIAVLLEIDPMEIISLSMIEGHQIKKEEIPYWKTMHLKAKEKNQ